MCDDISSSSHVDSDDESVQEDVEVAEKPKQCQQNPQHQSGKGRDNSDPSFVDQTEAEAAAVARRRERKQRQRAALESSSDEDAEISADPAEPLPTTYAANTPTPMAHDKTKIPVEAAFEHFSSKRPMASSISSSSSGSGGTSGTPATACESVNSAVESNDIGATEASGDNRQHNNGGVAAAPDDDDDDDDEVVIGRRTKSRRRRSSVPDSDDGSDSSSEVEVLGSSVVPPPTSAGKIPPIPRRRRRRDLSSSSEEATGDNHGGEDADDDEGNDDDDDEDEDEGSAEESSGDDHASHRAIMLKLEREREAEEGGFGLGGFRGHSPSAGAPHGEGQRSAGTGGQASFALFVQLLARAGDPGGGEDFMARLARHGKRGRHAGLLAAAEQVSGRLGTLVESQFGTMAWKQHFRDDVRAFPRVAAWQLGRGSVARAAERRGVEPFGQLACEACGRSGHAATHKVVLFGEPYDAFSFQNSDRWDRAAAPAARARAARGREAGRTSYYVGSTCRAKAQLYHTGWHYKYRLFQRALSRLEDQYDGDVEAMAAEDGESGWTAREFKRLRKYLRIVESGHLTHTGRAAVDDGWYLWSEDEGGNEGEDDSSNASSSEGGDEGRRCAAWRLRPLRTSAPPPFFPLLMTKSNGTRPFVLRPKSRLIRAYLGN